MDHNQPDEKIVKILRERFPGFSGHLIGLISSVAKLVQVKKGNLLVHSGEYLKHTVLVVEGVIKIYRESDEGGEAFLYYLEPGNACALSMLCASRQKTSEISAVAIENSAIIKIPIQFTDELMKHHHDWYNFVIETYRSRFEEMLEVFDNVVFKKMDERLQTYLENQFEKLATDKIELTHQEIANDLNTSREVVSRLLKKMEQQGLVELNRRYIQKVLGK